MKTIAYILALTTIAIMAAPAEAAKKSKSRCVTIESTGSAASFKTKAKWDANKAWRIDAARQVAGLAADRMVNPRYDCNKQGASVLRHVNWVCSVRAEACAGQRWQD